MPTATKNINAEKIQGNLSVTSVTGSFTGSLTGIASTASFVDPLNQNVLITGSLTVSSSNAAQLQVGSNLLYINNSNDVGIGTTSPSSYLGGTNGIAIVKPVYAGISLSTTSAGVNSNWLIYKMYNGQLSIYETTANRDRFNISYGGQVGIGSGPTTAARLVVQGAGSTSATTTLLLQNASSTDLLKVTDDGATTIVGNTTITGSLTVSSSNATQLQIGSDLLYVNNSNDVGIGTTSPSSYLAGTKGLAIRNSNASGQGISLSGTNNGYNWLMYRMGSGFYLSFYEQAYNRERLTIAASGEVGIGAPTTAARLAVYGAGSTSATSTFIVENASAAKTIQCKDDQSIGFFGATTVTQPTTAGASSTFTSNPGTPLNDADTYDGYTIAQVVKALRQLGLLA